MKTINAVFCGLWDSHHLDSLFTDADLAKQYAEFRGDFAEIKEFEIIETIDDLNVPDQKWLIKIDMEPEWERANISEEFYNIVVGENGVVSKQNDVEGMLYARMSTNVKIDKCRPDYQDWLYIFGNSLTLHVVVDSFDLNKLDGQRQQAILIANKWFDIYFNWLKEQQGSDVSGGLDTYEKSKEFMKLVNKKVIVVDGFEQRMIDDDSNC